MCAKDLHNQKKGQMAQSTAHFRGYFKGQLNTQAIVGVLPKEVPPCSLAKCRGDLYID